MRGDPIITNNVLVRKCFYNTLHANYDYDPNMHTKLKKVVGLPL